MGRNALFCGAFLLLTVVCGLVAWIEQALTIRYPPPTTTIAVVTVAPWDWGRTYIAPGESCHTVVTRPPRPLPSYVQCVRRSGDLISTHMQSYGRWLGCDNLLKLWKEAGPNPGLFVDAGANIGACTLVMLAAGARVEAFEPLPSNLYYLLETMRLNRQWQDRLRVWPVALGADPGEERIYSEPGNAGNSPLRHPTRANPARALKVRTVTLDSVLGPGTRISLLKMDVQGFEAYVLDGTRRLLQERAIRAVQLEVATEWLRNVERRPSEVCWTLLEAGFELTVLECAGRPRRGEQALSYAECRTWDLNPKVECEIVARQK